MFITLEKKDTLLLRHSDKVLELVETQSRQDENSLTQSDLQGASEAIMNIAISEDRKQIERELRKILTGIEGDTYTYENITSLINLL